MKRYDVDSLDNRDPKLIERLAPWVERILVPYHRAEVRGVERVPGGAALYVGNHNSSGYTPDSYIFSAAVHRAHGVDAVPHGLAHEFALNLPILNQILSPMGAVRACPENGERLLRSGRKTLVYPGGDIDSLRPFRHRNRIVFGGRQGYIRLALRARTPIIPVVAAGAHSTFVIVDDLRWLAQAIGADRKLRIKAWPLILSMPWGLTVGLPLPYLPFPSRILIEIMEPITFARSGTDAADDENFVAECAAQVERAMQATLTQLAGELKGR